nr:MAG: ORF2 [Torque teno polar bear virus 36]
MLLFHPQPCYRSIENGDQNIIKKKPSGSAPFLFLIAFSAVVLLIFYILIRNALLPAPEALVSEASSPPQKVYLSKTYPLVEEKILASSPHQKASGKTD